MFAHILLGGENAKKTVEERNRAGGFMQKNGFKFFYHHLKLIKRKDD